MVAYQEYMVPLVLTATKAVTLPVAIAQFGAENLKYWTVSAAGAVSISLPIILVILLGSKYMLAGLTGGAVKQ